MRETIVLAAGLPENAAFDIDWDYRLADEGLDSRADAVRRLRAERNRIDETLPVLTDHLVHELVSAGFSVRDTAILAGVSAQRVSQLMNTVRVEVPDARPGGRTVLIHNGVSEVREQRGRLILFNSAGGEVVAYGPGEWVSWESARLTGRRDPGVPRKPERPDRSLPRKTPRKAAGPA